MFRNKNNGKIKRYPVDNGSSKGLSLKFNGVTADTFCDVSPMIRQSELLFNRKRPLAEI